MDAFISSRNSLSGRAVPVGIGQRDTLGQLLHIQRGQVFLPALGQLAGELVRIQVFEGQARAHIDIAVEMADKNVSSDMRTNAEILDKLRTIQNKGDKQDEKRIDLELEQKKADIEQTEAQIKATEESVNVQKAEVSGGGTKKKGEEKTELTKGKSPSRKAILFPMSKGQGILPAQTTTCSWI